jgi:hypothetical protein
LFLIWVVITDYSPTRSAHTLSVHGSGGVSRLTLCVSIGRRFTHALGQRARKNSLNLCFREHDQNFANWVVFTAISNLRKAATTKGFDGGRNWQPTLGELRNQVGKLRGIW